MNEDKLGNFSSVRMSDQPLLGRSIFQAHKAVQSNDNEDLVLRAKRLFKDIHFPDYTFYAKEGHGGVHLYAEYMDADIYTGAWEMQRTRHWRITPAMTDSEIVQTMFKCCLTSYEHRCREAFKYKGARIFGPHFDVEDLVKLCKEDREDAGGRK